MARRPPLPPGPFLVVGLARSGRAVGPVLRALGEEVTGCDAGAVDAAVLAALESAGVAVHESTDGRRAARRRRDGRQEPGRAAGRAGRARCARARPARAGRARARLAARPERRDRDHRVERQDDDDRARRPDPSRGRAAGGRRRQRRARALSSLAGTLDPAAVVVCEASSFQLEDTVAFAPEAAVLLNLTPDHLDRHGSFDAYRDAKLRIFANQDADALAVLPTGLEHGGPARRIAFESPLDPGRPATPGDEADLVVRDGRLVWLGEPVVAAADIRLRGAHNLENAMAAAAVTLARGVDPAAVRAALVAFAGVAHRLEEVAPDRGRPLRRRLQGDQRGLGGGRDPLVPRRRPRDPRRPRQAGGLRAARRGGRRALHGRVPDRRGGGPAPAPRWRRPACRCTTAATSSARWRRPGRPRRRARSCCSRPPAPPTTSTAPSRSAASTSRRSPAAERARAAARGGRARGCREASGPSCRIQV